MAFVLANAFVHDDEQRIGPVTLILFVHVKVVDGDARDKANVFVTSLTLAPAR